MASDMATRRLRKELMAIKRNPIDNIVAMPMDNNILEWHYVITGTKGSPYEGGHYHGKLKFPPEYPMKPPSVMMMTPNGRFACSRRLCLSMSDFHPESWNPMWSVSTILMGLYSFMLDNAATLGSVTSSTAQKKRFATESLEVNCKNPAFRKLFPDLVELHERRKSEAIAHRREADASASAGSATSGAGLTTGAAAAAAAAAGGGVPSGGKAGSGASAGGGGRAAGGGGGVGTGAPGAAGGEFFCWVSVAVAMGVCGAAYVLATVE
ncbi:unnamed protein product [Ectocarpus sp. 6 AP-2014]